jgi:hypothetical protein
VDDQRPNDERLKPLMISRTGQRGDARQATAGGTRSRPRRRRGRQNGGRLTRRGHGLSVAGRPGEQGGRHCSCLSSSCCEATSQRGNIACRAVSLARRIDHRLDRRKSRHPTNKPGQVVPQLGCTLARPKYSSYPPHFLQRASRQRWATKRHRPLATTPMMSTLWRKSPG